MIPVKLVFDIRYTFQGQEKDNEVWEGGVAFKYRVEDARLGRFFSVDPLASKFPWNSSYAFAENHGVSHIELEGLEGVNIVDHTQEKTSIEIDYYYITSEENGTGQTSDPRSFTAKEIETMKASITEELMNMEKSYDLRYKKDDGSYYDIEININFIPCPDIESVRTCIQDPEVIERSAFLINVPTTVSSDGLNFSKASASNQAMRVADPAAGRDIVHEIFHNLVHHGSKADPTVTFMGFDPDNQGPWHERWGGIFSYKNLKAVVTQSNIMDAILSTPTHFIVPYPPNIPWKALGL